MLTFDCCSSCTYEDTGHEEVPSSYIRAAEFCVIASIIIKQNAGTVVWNWSQRMPLPEHTRSAHAQTTRKHSLRRRRHTYKDENNWAVLGDMLGRFDLVGLRDSDSQTDGRTEWQMIAARALAIQFACGKNIDAVTLDKKGDTYWGCLWTWLLLYARTWESAIAVRTIIGVSSVLCAVRFPVHLEFLWGRTGLESIMQWINYCENKLATEIAITCRDRYFWRTLCNSRNGRSNSPRTVARVTTSLVT